MAKDSNEKKQKEKPNQRKLAFRNEAINELVELDDESQVTFQKAMEVAKLDCKKCPLHDVSHNPKHQNCRDNPFCINRLGLEKFEKLIAAEIEHRDEAKKDQKRRDLNDQPAGLINGGNFCYVNSFLQVWFNVPEFRQIVYDFRPAPNFDPAPNTKLNVEATMLALMDIFYTLQTTPFTDTEKTSDLVKLLRLNTEQQDSQEFGLKFFNALERTLPEHPNGKDILERLTKLFTGQICTRIVCKCGQRSGREETAISLTLNIEGHASLQEALDAYFGEEHLDDYKCSRCNKTGDVCKQADYVKLPPVIVIQLNRYKYTAKGRQKLKTPLAYPREIPANLFQRIDQSNPPPASMYDLFAVTIHEGSNAECGHYYDLIKSPYNQKWYRYNDETVEAIPKPPGTDRRAGDKGRKKDKEKMPADQKACYGLLYRRRDEHMPLPHPRLPPDELIAASKQQIEESFEGQTKRKIEKSEKRLYDLKRRVDKLKVMQSKMETHSDKYSRPGEIVFLPTSLISDVLAMEYEVAKGEKKKKKKVAEEESGRSTEKEKKVMDEDEELAAAIAASEADQIEIQKAAAVLQSTSSAAMEAEEEPAEEASPTHGTSTTEMSIDSNAEADPDVDADAEEPMDCTETTKDLDIVAIAMEESELPTVEAPVVSESKKRLRVQNGTAKYVFSAHRSPRKTANVSNGSGGGVPKQPVSSRVAALLSSHEMPICGHGKMSIDSILFGDVKAVSRAPAIAMLREYDFRTKLVYEDGRREFPQPERDREVYVFTAEDICMECVKEMREEGIFTGKLEEDEKLVRKILKEEKLRCSVKCPTKKPDDWYYVAKPSLTNFKKAAQTVRENKLALLHTKEGTLHLDSITTQKEDTTYPALVSLKRNRGRPRKNPIGIREKIPKVDDNGLPDTLLNETMTTEDDDDSLNETLESVPDVSPAQDQDAPALPTKPVESMDPEVLKPIEKIEFNSELRCAHDGVNFSQFRHAVSPDEWNVLKGYFDECFEVKCSEPVCEECRQMEVDAQNGTDNMRLLVREMRKRINDTLKKVESRETKKSDEQIKFGICSVFIDKLKKLTTRQSTSPPSICQECILCPHKMPFKGFQDEDNIKDAHVIGVTEEEWKTFVTEIRNLEEAGDEHNAYVEPRVIPISADGHIEGMCDPCYEQHMKFTEEQKYTFENENIYVKLVNPADDEDVPKANGKSRRGRAKNVYAFKVSSTDVMMDLKVQLYEKTHQMPNDQLLYRTVGGEQFDRSTNQKTLFDLKLRSNNNEYPLIMIVQKFSPPPQTDETGDRAPERGFVDTALAH